MEGCGVSTSAAMPAIVGSQASVAANQAAQARKAAQCAGTMDGFTHATATVEQRQQYAECVELLYPSDDAIGLSAAEVLLMAGLLVAIFGVIYARHEGTVGMAALGVFWAGIFSVVASLGWLIWQAIKYVPGVTG